MENREIYSKWVYKLKKQIRQLKEEKEAIDRSCLFWMEEANKYRQKAEYLQREVTKRVYFIGNERILIAHDSNRLRFS